LISQSARIDTTAKLETSLKKNFAAACHITPQPCHHGGVLAFSLSTVSARVKLALRGL